MPFIVNFCRVASCVNYESFLPYLDNKYPKGGTMSEYTFASHASEYMGVFWKYLLDDLKEKKKVKTNLGESNFMFQIRFKCIN